MATPSTVILSISLWLIFILFVCALVRRGAIREREQHDQLLASSRQFKAHTASELSYWETQSPRSVTSGEVKGDHGDWPDVREGLRPEESSTL
jgi:hypothetical protein